jgi:hypothetical protein
VAIELITPSDYTPDRIAQVMLQEDLSDPADRRIHCAQIDLIKTPDEARDAFPAKRNSRIEMQ